MLATATYGQRYLAAHGFATVYASMDFETRSHAGVVRRPDGGLAPLPGLSDAGGLFDVGTVNYVKHPTFRPISLQYDLKDGKGVRLWKWGQPPPWDLHQFILAGGIIQSWNVGFEYWVWQLYCVPKLGWPALKPDQLRCVMAKSRVFGLPGALADAGTVPYLNLQHVKDPRGKELIKKLTKPRKHTQSNTEDFWEPTTAAQDYFDFNAYGVQDVVTESEASLKLPDLTEHELTIWRVDQTINRRGMQIDGRAVENCLAIVEQAIRKYHARLLVITNNKVSSSSEVKKTIEWARDTYAIHIPDLDEETVAEWLEKPDLPPALKEVLQIRQKLAFGSVKKLYAMRYHSTAEGRLHDQYVYAAARTRRWNGVAVQPTNLYKGNFNTPEEIDEALAVIASRSLSVVENYYGGDALEIVANCLRSMIVAAPGHILHCSDFSAIEGVACACLAGEQWRIEVFRTHGKIYEMTAAKLKGIPFEELLEYKRLNGKHHPFRQPYGKIPELSGQYQAWIGGWKKFGADKFMSDPEIKRAILAWRKQSPMIEMLWGGQTIGKFTDWEQQKFFGLEGAAVQAVRNPGQCFGYRGILYQVDPSNDILYCRPPSGELLPYHRPRLTPQTRKWASPWEQELTYEGWNSNAAFGPKGWVRLGLYGGKLTENLVQHVCRELQAGALVRCEAAGYPVVMHTHDEICVEMPIGQGSAAGLEALMTPVEDWAVCDDGGRWPIKAAGGWSGPRYGKWE